MVGLAACARETVPPDLATPDADAIRAATATVAEARIVGADREPGNWLAHGRTYDERRHSPLTRMAFPFERARDFAYRPGVFNSGIDIGPLLPPKRVEDRIEMLRSIRGHPAAWDPVRQREAWRVPHAGSWNGGVLSTAGNLVFQGAVGRVLRGLCRGHGSPPVGDPGPHRHRGGARELRGRRGAVRRGACRMGRLVHPLHRRTAPTRELPVARPSAGLQARRPRDTAGAADDVNDHPGAPGDRSGRGRNRAGRGALSHVVHALPRGGRIVERRAPGPQVRPGRRPRAVGRHRSPGGSTRPSACLGSTIG